MAKARKAHPRPNWLKNLPPGIVGYGPARLYFYLCAGGPNTCKQWNCRLANVFHVSRRTIERWTRRLEELALITLENRQSPYRRIHPLYYKSAEEFTHSARAKEIRSCIGKIGINTRFHSATSGGVIHDKRINYNSLTSNGRASKLARPVTKTAQAPRGFAVQDAGIAERLAYIEARWRNAKAEMMEKANKIKRRYK